MLVEIPKEAIIQQSGGIPEGIPGADITPEENSSLSIIPRLGINPVMHSLERSSSRSKLVVGVAQAILSGTDRDTSSLGLDISPKRSIDSNLRGSERFRHGRGRRPRCSKCNEKHTSAGECRGGGTLGLNPAIQTPFKVAA